MGTELMTVCVKDENDDIPSVPPGFEAFAAFSINGAPDSVKQESSNLISCSPAASTSESHTDKMETEPESSDATKVTRSRRRRPGINYGQFDDSSEDEFDPVKLNKNLTLRPPLPKGVIRGCPQCSTCQRVTARWRPEHACRPDLEDAPVFYPTEEEFEDTLKYIASIRPKAEPYGICRIVPPPSWKPPCPLKEKPIWEGSTFATRVQRVDKLQNRDSMKKMSRVNNHTKKKRRRCMRMAVDCGSDVGCISGSSDGGIGEAERFGFEPGPEFTLNIFQKYADDFKSQYFRRNDNVVDKEGIMTMLQDNWEPTVENIEGEYWRIVEKSTEEIEVLYGADLETGAFGSGFPKQSAQSGSATNDATDERYAKSGWNLNNFPRLPGSVLSFESGDISGVLVPWLYVGMCFSSFCWHVEDHHLYSLNYMHWGAPKIWYGVPGLEAVKLEEAMRKHLPDLFEEQPDLLHKLVTQLSPSILKSEGVPVYQCVQNSGEFVLTFPRAYHSGFNCGFNCAEAVNVAPIDWLPHGQTAIELYQEQGRRTSVSHDKLLLGAAREAVRAHWELNLLKKNTLDNLRWKDVCGKDGILSKALKARVEMERVRREHLCNSAQALKMESNFDATSERECTVCLFDLHLSAAGCRCSPDKYACLNHAKQLCSCSWGAKFFLFRYDINELNILVEALEGKLSAVYRWARLDLGLALTSYVSTNNMHEGKVHKEAKSQTPVNPLREVMGKGAISTAMSATGVLSQTAIEDKKKLPEALTTSISSLPVIDKENHKSNKEGSIVFSTNSKESGQYSVEGGPHASNFIPKERILKKPSSLGQESIVLSDDEGDEPKKVVPERAKENSAATCYEFSQKLSSSDKVVNDNKDAVLALPAMDAAASSRSVVNSLLDEQRINHGSNLVQAKYDHQQHGWTPLGSSALKSSWHGGPTPVGLSKIVQNHSSTKVNCMGNSMGVVSAHEQAKNDHHQHSGTSVGSNQLYSSCYGGPTTAELGRVVQNLLNSRETCNENSMGSVSAPVQAKSNHYHQGVTSSGPNPLNSAFLGGPPTAEHGKVIQISSNRETSKDNSAPSVSAPSQANNNQHQHGGTSLGSKPLNSSSYGGPTALGLAKIVQDPSNTREINKESTTSSLSAAFQANNNLQQFGTSLDSNQLNSSRHGGPAGLCRILNNPNTGETCTDNSLRSPGCQHPQSCDDGKPKNEYGSGVNATLNPVDNSKTMIGSPSCSQNSLDRYIRQKGPRIAKVVRRINCNVEPLEFGVVISGKLWCNSQAIFPKGFRSRVRYINVLDPTNMCYYVSEILDSGRSGPLFMVLLEHYPSEVFIHVSATRCWEMVRERVNQEIAKQHKLGKMNLPPLQPPGSLDGLEMFGFSSPAIVQAVEALDRNRVCTEYWDSRPYSRPQGQIPQHSQCKENGGNSQGKPEGPGSCLLPDGVDIILRGLFKKANPEELYSLSSILSDNRPAADRGLITRLLNDEIHNRPR